MLRTDRNSPIVIDAGVENGRPAHYQFGGPANIFKGVPGLQVVASAGDGTAG